ncbi:MAG: hypothetical protein CMQ05_00570 [Gammaproteobacteria bacterium]|nr:hypothetical protein [Gammaproteobacteria bacterium]RPG25590.1 MAG: DUF2062 domain-containing protein [Gammaproteobacteria bacterium TMED50]
MSEPDSSYRGAADPWWPRPVNACRRWYHELRGLIVQHPPEFAARGVAIGMFAAFTPTIGIQIPVIIGFWMAVRRQWNFSIAISIACTFVTNFATAFPIYYVFLVTGRIMQGAWDDLNGYDAFAARLSQMLPEDAGTWEVIWVSLNNIISTYGASMFLGCLPWATSISALSYFVVLRYGRMRRRKSQARLPSTGSKY